MTMMYSWFVLGKMNQRTQDAYEYALKVAMGRN